MTEDAPQQPFGTPRLTTILIFVLALFILFDPGLRKALGGIVGLGLEPLVGFGGDYPVVSLFLTGMIMTTLSLSLRMFFTDYVEQAKSQKIMSAFNQEMRAARLENNLYKIKKLTEQQQQVMAKQMEVSAAQMKTMPVTMIIVIPIFAWVAVFIGDLSSPVASVPWSFNVDLNSSYVLPAWVLLYSLISIPYGQVLSRTLRYFSFKKRLAELPAE